MISNPSPKRNIHLLGRGRLKIRYLLLILMGFVVLCVSRPYHPPKEELGEPAALEVPAESGTLIQETVLSPPPVTVEGKSVRRGDTLYDILKAKGLSDKRIIAISNEKIDGINP
ncbi:hypothetical protein MUP29_01660, partial [bacterium]|nr:hypothetical protein [bacterium]